MKSVRLAGVTLALTLLSACAPQPAQPVEPPDTRAADEASIRGLVKEWAGAARAKDSAKFASFYADDAVLMLEQTPLFTGKTAISDSIGPMMQDPNFALHFETTRVDVARSGDLASEQGTFELTTSDQKTKKAVTTKGKYVVVWKKQDSTWKVIVDAPISNPPSEPTTK
jgi:uncharacterized protein (TIGR02246 family)